MKTLNFEEMEVVQGGNTFPNFPPTLFCDIVGGSLDGGWGNDFSGAFLWYQANC